VHTVAALDQGRRLDAVILPFNKASNSPGAHSSQAGRVVGRRRVRRAV